MRKITFLLCIALCIGILSAQETPSIDYSVSPVLSEPGGGEYLVYLNTLEDEHKVYTIIYLEDQRYFMQVRNLSTGDVQEFHVTFGLEDKLFTITDIKLIAGDPESKDIEHGQIDLFNILLHRMQQDVSRFPKSIVNEQRVPELNYTFLYDYRYWVPIFNLYNRNLVGYSDRNIKLIRFGRLRENNMEDILEFKGINTDIDKSPSMALDKKDAKEIIFDNISLPLDENWESTGNNIAVLASDGEAYAYIRIISFPKETMDTNPYVYFSQNLMNSISYVLPVTVVVSTFKQYPVMKYVEYSEEEQKKNQIILQFFDRGEGISILQFAASKNFYDEHTEYFQNILF